MKAIAVILAIILIYAIITLAAFKPSKNVAQKLDNRTQVIEQVVEVLK